jgi:Importin-beta N-terminal domain
MLCSGVQRFDLNFEKLGRILIFLFRGGGAVAELSIATLHPILAETMDLQSVQAAISALYGNDANESARANTYLMQCAEQPAAWSLGIELTSTSADTASQFFGANLLLTKIKRHWHQACFRSTPQLQQLL